MRASPFPPGFFDRADEHDDAHFYAPPRLVTHIDPGAIAAVSELYRQLDLGDDVLDLCASWVSHMDPAPERLTVLGMNAAELEANPAATRRVVHDLNADPDLGFDDASFDAVTCCVSIDYLIRPVEVLAEVARVLRPGGVVVCTFSNRCFPTKAIRGWLAADESMRPAIVTAYLHAAGGFDEPVAELCVPGRPGDPLWAVHARRRPASADSAAPQQADHTAGSDLSGA